VVSTRIDVRLDVWMVKLGKLKAVEEVVDHRDWRLSLGRNETWAERGIGFRACSSICMIFSARLINSCSRRSRMIKKLLHGRREGS